MITSIMNGLDFEYNPLVSSILGCADCVSLSDMYSQLMAYDLRLKMYQGDGQYQSSANMAGRGRGRGPGSNHGHGKEGQNQGRGQQGGQQGGNAPRQGR